MGEKAGEKSGVFFTTTMCDSLAVRRAEKTHPNFPPPRATQFPRRRYHRGVKVCHQRGGEIPPGGVADAEIFSPGGVEIFTPGGVKFHPPAFSTFHHTGAEISPGVWSCWPCRVICLHLWMFGCLFCWLCKAKLGYARLSAVAV